MINVCSCKELSSIFIMTCGSLCTQRQEVVFVNTKYGASIIQTPSVPAWLSLINEAMHM